MLPFLHQRTSFRHLAAFACVFAGFGWGCCRAHEGTDAIFTNAVEVLSLNANEAAQARPVRLRAVVIDEADPKQRALIVADQTAGLYVLGNASLMARFHRRDLIELTGVSNPGEFAPIVKVTAAKKLGTAPLPSPREVTYHQLATGTMDAQWVEVKGVVQQYLPAAPGTTMRFLVLSVDGGLVHVRMAGPHDPKLLEDAEVRVQALCFYQFNQKRQMRSPVLQVPPGIPITIQKFAPADPFAAPVPRRPAC